MAHAPHVVLPMAFLILGLAGCLGGSPQTCVPAHGDGEGEPMTLLTDPQGPDGAPGWQLVVQCNEDENPLAAYRFVLETAEDRTITAAPVGTWTSPATFYAGTSGTEPGASIQATQDNPGNSGDPTYRLQFFDENTNGVVDAEDRIEIGYDAGMSGTTTFESPFEGGLYRSSVFEKEGNQLVARVQKTFPAPQVD